MKFNKKEVELKLKIAHLPIKLLIEANSRALDNTCPSRDGFLLLSKHISSFFPSIFMSCSCQFSVISQQCVTVQAASAIARGIVRKFLLMLARSIPDCLSNLSSSTLLSNRKDYSCFITLFECLLPFKLSYARI